MDADRKKKLDKLAKLLALANNNPNKAEAMAAIAKLTALREEYGFTDADIENGRMASEGIFTERSAYSGEKDFGFCDRFLWKSIADFCGVMVGVGTDEDGDLTIRFYGLDSDVDLAFWLRNQIKAAMAFEWGIYRDFVMGPKERVSVAMPNFHMGFAEEMRERMSVVRVKEQAASGRNEIMLKSMEIVRAKARDAGFTEAVGGRRSTGAGDASAYSAGRDAGGRVNMGRAVTGGGAKMIAG